MASRSEQKEQARAQRVASEEAAHRGERRRSAIMRLGLVLGLAVVVVVAAIVISSGGDKAATGTGERTGGFDAAAGGDLFRGIPQTGVDLGPSSARATLIEFADLQCPYCAQYSKQALPTVVNRYVKPGKLRYELRLRSFLGKDSARAAGAAAEAARENRLYEFSDLFYRRQQPENSGYVTDGFVRSVAGDSGVNSARAVAAANDAGAQPLVGKAEQLAASLGSTSTPSFYLRLKGGRLVPLAPQDLTGDAISQAIDQALSPQT